MSDVPTQYQISSNVVTWIFEALGAVVLFFVSLGVKDMRDKLKKVDKLCLEITRLNGRIDVLEAKINRERS